jgi:hypothetical protein
VRTKGQFGAAGGIGTDGRGDIHIVCTHRTAIGFAHALQNITLDDKTAWGILGWPSKNAPRKCRVDIRLGFSTLDFGSQTFLFIPARNTQVKRTFCLLRSVLWECA